jgi:Ion channel
MSAAPPTEHHRLGSRARRLRASHSYGYVLGLIIASFVFAMMASDDDWAASVLLLLYCTTLVTALWTSGRTRLNSRTTVGLAWLAAVAAASQLVFGGNNLAALVALCTGVLIGATIVVIALGVLDQGIVNAQSVQGALCVYVLLGLMFAFLYGMVAELGDGDFFAQGTDGDRAVRVYFSFVTLATVGYGDYTAANDVGRTLAVVEGLSGQLYLVTVIALLVSRIGFRHPTRAASRGPGASPQVDEAAAGDPG